MTIGKEKIWFCIAVVFAVCLTMFTLSYIVMQPWHTIPALGGDGAKNIFTYLYQSTYGKGYWFDGMNYPYGEHITYTDGQPLLSVLFASLHNVSIGAALTTLWLLIGLSYVLCVVYLYKILIHFKLTPPVAVVFAGLITIFSPQIFRMSGHYALAYMNVIPMLFYWTIKYHEQPLRKYCVYIFLLVTTMAFLHLYFAAVSLVWVLCYVAGCFLFTKGKLISKLKHVLPLAGSILLAFCTTAAVVKLTDPLKDRPAIPYGILEYTTHRKDILTSAYSPIWRHLKEQNVFSRISEGGEGYTYLGLAVIIAILCSFVVGILNRSKKNEQDNIVREGGFSPVWLFMAFGALLFSMGVPYIWHMEWLLNYTSFMRQFRTLGRFSWIFYYIVTVYGAVVIYTFYARLIAKQKVVQGYAILLLAIVIWSYEASGYVKVSRSVARGSKYNYDMLFSTQEQNWQSFLNDHHYDKNNFQCILLLPYFHVGSEKIWIDAGWVATLGMKAALQLRLPIIDVMMSRSSWSQMKKQVKIAAGPYAGKPILGDIKSDKPFLLLHFEDDSLNADQKYLLQASDYIGHYSQCNVYACYPGRLAANDKRIADRIDQVLPFMKGMDTCIEQAGPWYTDHLDALHAKDRLFGSGAMSRISGADSNVAMIPIRPLKDSQEYEFSCWFLLGDRDYSSPYIILESLDSTGNAIDKNDVLTKCSVDNIGMWFRASLFFYPKANCRMIRCRLVNDPNPSYKVMDEILLRPADALIISKAADGSVMVNNHLFKKD